jgi:hypothetical protein
MVFLEVMVKFIQLSGNFESDRFYLVLLSRRYQFLNPLHGGSERLCNDPVVPYVP